jgi:hypothetical protein
MLRVTIIVTHLVPALLWAASGELRLVKDFNPAFADGPRKLAWVRCEVGAEKTVVTKTMGNLTWRAEQRSELSGNVEQLVALAAAAEEKGQVEKGPRIMDVPTTTYLVIGNGKSHVLFSKGSVSYFNRSLAAKYLVSFLDAVCP